MAVKSSGLEGVIVSDSAICSVGATAHELTYRGYSIEDLAQQASFEEVAYLLIYGHLPTLSELKNYQQKLMRLRQLPNHIIILLENIPAHAHPMDVLRTACSMLGIMEPETPQNNLSHIADRLLACIPSMLLYWHHFHQHGQRINMHSKEETIAGYFLTLLHQQKPPELWQKAFDVSLILYAEHEFNASTFAARVTTSTGSDYYSAIVSAIGCLRGPLHGGANEAAMQLIQRFKTAHEAEKEIKAMLAKKIKIMGFGHRVYKTSDPRSSIIKAWSKKLSVNAQDNYLFTISEHIEKIMHEEKKLFPNLDFYSATSYHFCNIPTYLFTPIFVLSRLSGWSAHILEQRENNCLIRPDALYIGPNQHAFPPLNKRG